LKSKKGRETEARKLLDLPAQSEVVVVVVVVVQVPLRRRGLWQRVQPSSLQREWSTVHP
jgi:hypothetical protein